MHPAVFSFRQNSKTGLGWSRKGGNLAYDKSDFAFKDEDSRYAYTLSFELSVEDEDDTLLVSVVPPYPYSRLISLLK